MTPDEVRAIVREELAAIKEAEKLEGSVELTLTYANMELKAEQMLEEMGVPEPERETLLKFFKEITQ